jgi:peptidoglycan/xylan/chitin deacetylase (PgdA/CDA1 family)
MVSYTTSDLHTQSYGLKFVSIGVILIFLLTSTALICNKDYGLNNIGLAISQNPYHEGKSVNVVNTDKTIVSSRNGTKTREINSNLHSNTSTTSNGKLVILTFGDTIKNQLTTARPILDKYGFKASFFITCGFVDNSNRNEATKNINNDNGKHRMNWNDILQLQQDGQDIESKGMTHRDLNQLAPKDLEYETGGSKQCLENHGINSPNIFAAVHGNAWNNSTVIDMISKYYGFADNGFADLIFLRCDGYVGHKQTDCRTYDDGRKLTYANRYSIREESQNSLDQTYLHNDTVIFQKFKEQVNSQAAYNNRKGFLDAIPIVAYHSIDDSKGRSSTDVNLFASEMKYLHDNGFKIIPMSDLRYDQITNYMYIRNNQFATHLLST